MHLLPKRMVAGYAVAAPALSLDLYYRQARRNYLEISSLACTTSSIDDVHNKPTEEWEAQTP